MSPRVVPAASTSSRYIMLGTYRTTQIYARTPTYKVYVYYYTFPERARAYVYTIIYYMWANTCPLVDAYAPALPQTSADVFQGSQSSSRATAALRVVTRVHYFFSLLLLLYCAQTTSARRDFVLFVYYYDYYYSRYDRTAAVMMI